MPSASSPALTRVVSPNRTQSWDVSRGEGGGSGWGGGWRGGGGGSGV